MLLSDLLYEQTPLVDVGKGPDVRHVLANGIRAWGANLRNRPQRAEVLLTGSGAGMVPRDGRAFNRYLDYFATALGPRAWTAEQAFGDRRLRLPRANPRQSVVTDDRLAIAIASHVRSGPRHRRVAADLLDIVAARGRDVLGWTLDDDRRLFLERLGARRLAGYPAQRRAAARLLKAVRPRMLIAEEAAYGWSAVANLTAREAGVLVVEFQHGLVTSNHDAYNVAPALAESAAYRSTQPDVFLGYGSWWNDQFSAPIPQRIALGNPHREVTLAAWRAATDRPTVLVIGDGIETSSYLDLCRSIANAIPAPYRVVFRPHPLERASVEAQRPAGVVIDRAADLYESFRTAGVVIGELSTAILEAVGLVARIFIWDTAKSRFYFGDLPFDRFVTPNDLAALLQRDSSGSLAPELVESMWATGWRRRFEEFIGAAI